MKELKSVSDPVSVAMRTRMGDWVILLVLGGYCLLYQGRLLYFVVSC